MAELITEKDGKTEISQEEKEKLRQFLVKQEMNYRFRIKAYQNREKKTEDESEKRELQRCIRECERILRRIKRNMEILMEEGTV